MAEILDLNAVGITYQLDKNTRSGSRQFGEPDRSLAQINVLLSVTAAEIAAGVKLYVKTIPVTAASASVIGITIT